MSGSVLILDDEPALGRMVKAILEPAGLPCFIAENTFQASEYLDREKITLLLCDIQLNEEISGLTFARNVLQSHKDIGVIMMTGLENDSLIEEAFKIGVFDFISKPVNKKRLIISTTNAQRRLNLESQARNHQDHLEQTVAQRTDALNNTLAQLENTYQALHQSEAHYRMLVDNIPCIVYQGFADWTFGFVDPKIQKTTGFSSNEFLNQGKKWSDLILSEDYPKARQAILEALKKDGAFVREYRITDKTGNVLWIQDRGRINCNAEGRILHINGVFFDISEQKALESQLALAQKMESIGQLASGIAHEINTPTQYVGDNIVFLKDSFSDIIKLYSTYENLLASVKTDDFSHKLVHDIEICKENIDFAFLQQEIPDAFAHAMNGLERVSTIVRSIKDFAHPDTENQSDTDINEALETTLTVARNEWKYVAEIEKDYDLSLPAVKCYPGELNQVFLNIIVNAAHAIQSAGTKNDGQLGKIWISTRSKGKHVEIRIQDTGTGIPPKIQNKVFDPFFTTKPVGKGTGQGLAIAFKAIHEKHGGVLKFETEENKGTTFIMTLPVTGTKSQPIGKA